MQSTGSRADQLRAGAPLNDGNVDSCQSQLAGQRQAGGTSPGNDYRMFDSHALPPFR